MRSILRLYGWWAHEAAVVRVDESGSAISLAAFVGERGVVLTRFAYLVSGDRDRAQDLVQDVLLSMHRRFGPYLTIDDPSAYARRAIVNAHLSWTRRRRVIEIPSESLPEVPWIDDNGVAVDDEVWAALADLPARQRAVLVLRYYLGHSDREIADILSCREGSVRSLATRAFRTLRPVLRPAGMTREVTR